MSWQLKSMHDDSTVYLLEVCIYHRRRWWCLVMCFRLNLRMKIMYQWEDRKCPFLLGWGQQRKKQIPIVTMGNRQLAWFLVKESIVVVVWSADDTFLPPPASMASSKNPHADSLALWEAVQGQDMARVKSLQFSSADVNWMNSDHVRRLASFFDYTEFPHAMWC